MAHKKTDTKTEQDTDGHRNTKTEFTQWAKSVKSKSQRRNPFS